MNSIEKLISLANVRGSLNLRCQFEGAWSREHEQEPLGQAPYHIVLVGECRVDFPNGKSVPMRAGHILLLPTGAPHVMLGKGGSAAPTMPKITNQGAVPIHRIGGPSSDFDMLCGSFHFNRASLLFAALPTYLVIPTACGPLSALVEMLRSEADGQQVCSSFMLDALSQALFTLVLRAHLTSDGHNTGSLALLSDKRLCRAWQAMLADPAFEWKIEYLAELANMSRATFVRTFVRVAGASPWTLLTQVRMELATNLLHHSQLGLSEIAVNVGYQSQSAFTKKFKEFYGAAPGKARREI
ncbi:AraC family transcriptional regulator, activator of mtrCDE [Pseudomonas helmanticensis]|uniref:AraC family transcriptional regulator, activator of mtrCDE n=1 Tax=Pseudomonas helmanticensis TaxID=1471381 RepID=A0ACD2UD11_9PSED|nr:AraC family transcriptional regulator [Pseudomonas helmanticensis]SMQ30405.1 AraC family transcriptional regulator, activator of mtrCDE [Pseudomonas helmanticensis]